MKLKTFFWILLPPMCVLAIHLLLGKLFGPNNFRDNFVHFFGGTSIAWSTLRLRRSLAQTALFPSTTPRWLIYSWAWGLTALAGVLWEIYEFSGDQLFGTRMQAGLTDTMGDLILDISGGAVFLLFSWFRKRP